jgi:CRISPR-associated protein Csy3
MAIPKVLAFSRKLEVSDALMTSGLWDNIDKPGQWKDITLHDKRNRATFSQYGAKEEDKSKPNLSWGDDAALPHDADTLRVSFSLKIMGQLDQPTACDNPDFERKLVTAIGSYRDNHQFSELAARYANNIVNGRFLWRNRVGAASIKIHVKYDEQVWKFDAYDYDLDKFTPPPDGSDLDKLTNVISNGLSGDKFEYLEVTVYANIGVGQHVWPSQEMVLEKGEKSRILFNLNDCAAMHSEKIGNALRTIDTWYGAEVDSIRPIAVEPYGSVTSRGDAHRKTKNDFYTLLIKWLENSEDVPEKQQHFIIATLIRGGVFGGKDD